MDALELCNSLRMEFEGIYNSKIPLDALPVKLQDMVLALARQENYGGSHSKSWVSNNRSFS